MNADFIRTAHRRAVWAQLRRVLLDRFLMQDAPAKEQILCEEVPFAHKDVSNEAILEVYQELQVHEQEDHAEMLQFEHRKRDARPKRTPGQPDVEIIPTREDEQAPAAAEARQPEPAPPGNEKPEPPTPRASLPRRGGAGTTG